MELNEDTVGYRALVAAKVESERTGFEQCRREVGAYVNGALEEAEGPAHKRYDDGYRDALRNVLAWLGTQ